MLMVAGFPFLHLDWDHIVTQSFHATTVDIKWALSMENVVIEFTNLDYTKATIHA